MKRVTVTTTRLTGLRTPGSTPVVNSACRGIRCGAVDLTLAMPLHAIHLEAMATSCRRQLRAGDAAPRSRGYLPSRK